MFKRMIIVGLVYFNFPVYGAPLTVGVVDQSQCKEDRAVHARLCFVKTGKEWVTFSHSISEMAPDLTTIPWTIAFDGKSLGKINLSDPQPTMENNNAGVFNRDKLFSISKNKKLPLVENKLDLFAGWCDTPAYRPLVIISEPNNNDPERWKPFSPDDSLRKKLFPSLKAQIDNGEGPMHCPDGAMVNQSEPYTFGPDELVLYRTYASSSGKRLISIGLNTEQYGCDGPRESKWSDHWFLEDGNNILFLGTDMTLVDAGDYDGDGKSEVLFWQSHYNLDGYVLFYDSFGKHVDFLWSYH